MAYRDVVLVDSPVDFYEMETATGTDSGSGNRTLTLAGGITTGATGIIGKGWSYDGVNDQATMATFPGSASVANMSMEAWFKAPSNGGWTNDYPTFIRRDGTDIVLLRGRGSNLGSNPGKAEVYWDGPTIVSTNRVDDGLWHHIIVTVAGTAIKLYVDGVLQGSATGTATYNLGTGTAYVGGNAGLAAEFYQGSLDNVAIYSTALSATRVTAHYNAAFATASHTAVPMTASASMPGGFVPMPRTVTPAPMTATAIMPDGAFVETRTGPVTQDQYTSSSAATTVFGSGNTLKAGIDSGATYKTFIGLPSIANGETVRSAVLRVRTTTTASTTLTLSRIDAAWSQSTLNHNNAPATTAVKTVTLPTTTNAFLDIDVSGIAGTGFGLAISGTGPMAEFQQSESGISAPSVTYLVSPAPAAAVTYNAQPMSASVSLPDAMVGIGKDVAAEPMTATATLVNAVVSGERFYTHTAEPLVAFAETGDAQFALPVTVSAEVMNVDSMMPEAATATATGVIYYAQPVSVTASIVRPALVNGQAIVIPETEDAYFNRVFDLAPSVYQRLNDKGSTAVDRMGTYNGTYHGVQVGKFEGPDGRHSVYFPLGSYLEQTEPTGTNTDEAWIQDGTALATTLEFSFRTAKSNTFLMAGADQTQTSRGVASSYAARELMLKDGKITFRSRIFAGTPDQIEKEFSGARNLADNKWHTIHIRSGVYSRGEWAVEVWVDGTFEVRRFNTNGFMGFPDYIGFRPNYIDGSELEALPLSQGFEGDLTEVAFYNHNNLASHNIASNYYAFMGWAPIAAEPFEATAALVEGRGKGSQKKALYLYWNPTDEVYQNASSVDYGTSFDPMPGFVERATNAPNLPFTHHERVGDYHGLKVFSRSVRLTTTNESYRDPMTDDPSLINLETDIDLEEYDVIMFKDWPDEGPELDDIETNFPGQKTRLISQLRDANDRGVGLNITNPRMAVDFAVIDRVEFVGSLKETRYSGNQGAAFGLYDYGSALKFPWNISAADGLTGGQYASGIGVSQILSESYLENKAFFYHDTNANNRFRVRASVDGLTDLAGWMIKDAVWHVDYDQYGWQGAAYKYLKRDAGLLIGDEYIYHGSEVIGAKWLDAVERRFNRFNGTWAIPAGHVKAGTIVTTFGSKHWLNKSEVDNPYKDYATTVVLQPGDVLDGRPVGGRIFINFTEQPSYGLGVAVQEIPTGNTGWPAQYPVETTAQREWDWSWTRTSLISTGGNTAESVSVVMPNGDVQVIKLAAQSTDSMVRSNQLFPVAGKPRMEMTARGIYWLADTTQPEEGSKTVRATAMNVSAAMPEPVVTGRKTVKIIAEPVLATASMPRVVGDTFGEFTHRALPMRATTAFTGYGKTMTVQPLEATAEFVEPFDAVHAEGEQVALILHNYEATLYFKEEA